MLIVGKDLELLAKQHMITSNLNSVSASSLELSLGEAAFRVVGQHAATTIELGEPIPGNLLKKEAVGEDGLILNPGDCVLACSQETVQIPLGFFGFIQTVGTLARYFVTVHCCDGQIDAGFSGRVTFELCNLGPLVLRLRRSQVVSRLFIIQASRSDVPTYSGRYQGATEPTLPQRRLTKRTLRNSMNAGEILTPDDRLANHP